MCPILKTCFESTRPPQSLKVSKYSGPQNPRAPPWRDAFLKRCEAKGVCFVQREGQKLSTARHFATSDTESLKECREMINPVLLAFQEKHGAVPLEDTGNFDEAGLDLTSNMSCAWHTDEALTRGATGSCKARGHSQGQQPPVAPDDAAGLSQRPATHARPAKG